MNGLHMNPPLLPPVCTLSTLWRLLLVIHLLPLFSVSGTAGEHRLRIADLALPDVAGFTTLELALDTGDGLIVGGSVAGEATLRILRLAAAGADSQLLAIGVGRAAAVTANAGTVYFAGGDLAGVPQRRVLAVRFAAGGYEIQPLPDLPHPLVAAGAVVFGGRLYVCGGYRDGSPLALSSEFWSIDLGAPATGWRQEPSLPAAGRAYPGLVAHNGVLAVFGGLLADGDGGANPTAETWLYRVRPREGTLATGWQPGAALPMPLAGVTAQPAGPTQIAVVAAGVAPAATGSSAMLFYHTVTDAWAVSDRALGLASPRLAGASGGRIRALGLAEAGDAATGVQGIEVTVLRSARKLSVIDFAVIGCYFLTVISIGLYFSRRQKSGDGYALGNRNMKWWAAGMSMFATGASAISFMAIPAQVFGSNLIWLLPLVGQIIAFPLQAYLIFPLLRKLEITSTYEYLERRFNKPLRLIASAQSIIFQTFGRMTIVMVLPSIAISATTGIPILFSVLIMGCVTTLYTSLGGISAVIWTDVLQGALMLLTPLIVIAVAIANVPGGVSGFVATGIEYQKFNFALVSWDMALPVFWLLILNTFLTSTVQVAGDQPMIQKIFSAPVRDVRRTAGTLLVGGILIALLVQTMGVSIFGYFHHNPAALDPGVANDQIIPYFIVQSLPIGVAGLVIAAIFAAAISTLSGTMISVATLAEQDFFLRFMPGLSEKGKVRVLRLGSYTVGIVGTGLAAYLSTLEVRSIWDLWNSLAALLGGGVVGVYTLGMFTKRANGFGAVCGAVLSIVVTSLVKVYTPFHWASFLPIAIGTCVISGYLLSLLAPQRRDLTGLTVFTPADGATKH
jgi:solute:Na+ symporter, SSS family